MGLKTDKEVIDSILEGVKSLDPDDLPVAGFKIHGFPNTGDLDIQANTLAAVVRIMESCIAKIYGRDRLDKDEFLHLVKHVTDFWNELAECYASYFNSTQDEGE